jgi:hypothetical protein
VSFFQRLANLFGGGSSSDEDRFLTVYVLSHRCREPIEIRVDMHNEVSRTDDDDGFYVRKVIHTSGANRCFDQVELELWLDAKRNVINRDVQGGRWLTEDEYAEALARFHASAETEAQENGE